MLEPKVNFLITVFNGIPFINATVENLLRQTYSNFDIVIVDDGSTDDTENYINIFFGNNEKVKVLAAGRLGRAKALNFGLGHCDGKYIAINDADDFSDETRLVKQVDFLEKNRDFGLVGTVIRVVDTSTNESYISHRPYTDKEIKKALSFGQCIQHSSVMFRKDVLEKVGGFNEKLSFLIDRDVFIRVGAISKLANLEECLVTINVHKKQFFKETYKGRQRAIQSNILKLKAVHTFNLNKSSYIRIIKGLLWELLPGRFRKFVKKVFK